MVEPSVVDRAMGALDGCPALELARVCGVPAVHLFASLSSTMDVAHRLASSGAPDGTLVLSEEQVQGRGRQGRVWRSEPCECLTFTFIERPPSDGLDVLSLRLGLQAAKALDRWSAAPVQLKWPNDLKVKGAKLAGILVEARWRGTHLDWVSIGFGLNVRGAPWPGAATLAPGAERVEILRALVPALREAAQGRGALTVAELHEYRSRDWARDLAIVEPAVGTARGITATGALVIETAAGRVERTAGSLIPAENTPDVAGF